MNKTCAALQSDHNAQGVRVTVVHLRHIHCVSTMAINRQVLSLSIRHDVFFISSQCDYGGCSPTAHGCINFSDQMAHSAAASVSVRAPSCCH